VSPIAPTFSQIKAQVAAIRQKQDVQTLGIQTAGRWLDALQQKDGDDWYQIQQCDSPLAVRLALRERPSNATVQVILTSLEEEELGTDILLRLTKRRLFKVERWSIVKSLFDATTIDPRLIRHSCLADYLMEWVPSQGYPSVSGGFLDAETAWQVLLTECLGIISDRLDLASLLEWAANSTNIKRYQDAPKDFQEALLDWLTLSIGQAAQAILACCNQQNIDSFNAITVGLALDILFNPEAVGQDVERAIGKLEAGFLGTDIKIQPLAYVWSNSALDILRLRIRDMEQRKLIDRADNLLKNLGVEEFAYLSDVSIIGYEQRLTKFAESIAELIRCPTSANLQVTEAKFESLQQHSAAKQTQEFRHLEQCLMALRLARWLVDAHTNAPAPAKSLNDAVLYELQQGGFLDWARFKLHHGSYHRSLAKALKALFDTVQAFREKQAKRFADLVQSWTELGGKTNIFTPVEDILAKIIVPLVDRSRVLLIVMDGMGTSACNELIMNITQSTNWNRMVPEDYPASFMAGLATIPSITKVSRTSLLCGKLKSGNKNDEVKGFSSHPQLAKCCQSGMPPVLFHKDSLRNTANEILGDEVRKTVSSSEHRVVSVVINAIDDNLKQGDQISVAWDLDSLPILSMLLREAEESNRSVIILSDHGHIVDHHSEYQSKNIQGHLGGERWHSDERNVTDGELLLKGDRILVTDSHQVVVPWSEKVRYSKAANGHHGGINPQEVVIPIVIMHASNPPAQWKDAPADQPLWWNTTSIQPNTIVQAPPATSQPDFGPLFAADPSNAAPPLSFSIQQLLNSQIYHIQQKKAGKSALDTAIVERILVELERHNYLIHLVSLARLMNVSSKMMQSYLIKLQRTLNIDGYQILAYEPTSMTVRLFERLLHEQFSL
jgi:PglZ domain